MLYSFLQLKENKLFRISTQYFSYSLKREREQYNPDFPKIKFRAFKLVGFLSFCHFSYLMELGMLNQRAIWAMEKFSFYVQFTDSVFCLMPPYKENQILFEVQLKERKLIPPPVSFPLLYKLLQIWNAYRNLVLTLKNQKCHWFLR